MAAKTNAVRLLDQMGIRHELRTYEVDPEDLSAETVALKVNLPPEQAVTGYVRGAVTALAARKDYRVYANETIELFHLISISAGMRGMQILLAPADYLHAVKARIAAIARQK